MEKFMKKTTFRRTSPIYSTDHYICCVDCGNTKSPLIHDNDIGTGILFMCKPCWIDWNLCSSDEEEEFLCSNTNSERGWEIIKNYDIIQENEQSDETETTEYYSSEESDNTMRMCFRNRFTILVCRRSRLLRRAIKYNFYSKLFSRRDE